jgi:hypothetical protein
MRIKDNKPNQRSDSLTKKEVNGVVFLVFEGSCSEPMYFSYSKDQTKRIFRIVKRNVFEQGYSNPTQLLSMAKLIKAKKGRSLFTFADLRDVLEEDLKSKNTNYQIEANLYIPALEKYGNSINIKLDLETKATNDLIRGFLRYVKAKNIFLFPIIETNDLINRLEEDYTYCKDVDTIAIFADRDKISTHDDVYNEIVKEARKNGLELYISNPCFELFLLLHLYFPKKKEKSALLINAKNGGKDYSETLLQSKDSTYTKNNYNVGFYHGKYKLVPKRASKLATTLVNLRNQIGTNIPLFLKRELK